MQNGPNRIDPTPLRMSTNLSVDRQTPKTDFGERIKAGVSATAGALVGGAAVISPLVPGAGIVSAAVSSVGNLTASQGSGSVGGQYGSTAAGVASVGVGGVQTTVGGGGIGDGAAGGGGTSSVGGLDVQAANVGGGGQDMVTKMAAESSQLLKLQFQMQQETQVFQTISNVIKTRHDTAKNSIGNIR